MLYAGIDIHKQVFHAVVLDPVTGELCECRFQPSRERLAEWASEWEGKLAGAAIEATTGWRWVARELQAHGFDVHLLDAGRASALRGRRRKAKTDKLDAKWLTMILARDLLSECEAWIPPAEIQQLRDQTRLRKSLVESRTDWAQRLHALLTHEGWPCSRGRLLTREGRRWVTALDLDPAARVHVDVMIKVIEGFDEQIGIVERDLRRFSRRDSRCLALQTIFGVGAILSCHLLAEIGEATRFKRSRQLVRASGLDPAVLESADTKRRGRLSKQGSPHLRWALVQAGNQGGRTTSPDRDLYTTVATRCGARRAKLTVARKIARRAYHVLAAVETANLDPVTVA
jgi:transposase